jgi:hypothetical protein
VPLSKRKLIATVANSSSLPNEIQLAAQQGLRIFPCWPPGQGPYGPSPDACKHSRITDWVQLATCDLAQLAKWERDFPGCNWGVLTGEPGGIFILDTDGPAGEQWLAAQVEIHGEDWTRTLTVRTGRREGGHQLYYRHPEGVTLHSTTGVIAAGVDIKGWHSLGILPPSVHPSGRPYQWVTPIDHPILQAPPFLLATIFETGVQPVAQSENEGGEIPEGVRNDTLFRLGCSMRAKGMSEAAIHAGLLAENAASCSPPLDEREVEGIAASVAHYEAEPQMILTRPIKSTVDLELFETAAEFATKTPAETLWIVPFFIPEAGMAEEVAKVKSGKTALAMAMVRAALGGLPFLDQPCRRTPVVYLTEQGESSLRQALEKADLLGRHDLFLMRWHKTMGIGWAQLAAAAVEKAREVAARLIVVDTLGQFSQLLGDAENNAGLALEVLRPLQQAQAQGIASLIIRHERKSDAEISDAGRGSSAYAGAVDVLMRLRRLGASHPANYRKLETLSRFDQTPPESVVELTPEGYRRHDAVAVTLEAAEESILAALPITLREAKTVLELTAITKHNRTTVQRAITELVNKGWVKLVGAGVRGSAYHYYRTEVDGALQ